MPILAILRFMAWEAALFAAAARLARAAGWCRGPWAEEDWLGVIAIQVTLESSFAALFSFAGVNSPVAYWAGAALCAAFGARPLAVRLARFPSLPYLAAAAAPLVLLSFKPVEEIDSINYLHYLIDWMANRATPYTFATNYVAFWELSFLPTWMVTRVDQFFPILALKAVVLLGLSLWLAGKELGVDRRLLLLVIPGALAMRHFWYEYSGVPTLKNDALHGVGFVLLALVVMRSARREWTSTDAALLAFGAAFASVKYTGIFAAAIALAMVVLLRGWRWAGAAAVAVFAVVTSGHYYLHNLLKYGSPFYPFQINIGMIHLPGTADLSDTSILYSLHDPRLWRIFFLPEGGVSPAGLLFPVILALILPVTAWQCLRGALAWVRHRHRPSARELGSFLILCGWLLYFRSVFSASASAGDLGFVSYGLNSIRYVDGVLALSEICLAALAGSRWLLVAPLVAIHLVSRLAILYARIPAPVFPAAAVCAVAAGIFLMAFLLKRWAAPVLVVALVLAAPLLVDRNRVLWTTYWNPLKPQIQSLHGPGLASLALTDGGYFAGHVVAAGNPVDPAVPALSPEDLDALPPAARPHYLAVLVTPGSEAGPRWRSRYGERIRAWGYHTRVECPAGAIFEHIE